MRKFRVTIFILMSLIFTANAQVVPLVGFSKHRLYLTGNLKLCISLKYSNSGAEEQYVPRITGYSIDANLTEDNNGKKFMELNFYRCGHVPSKDSIMNINLYLEEMPKFITYYLNISVFAPGHRIVKVTPADVKKADLVYIDLNRGNAFDITNIVFPAHNEKKKE